MQRATSRAVCWPIGQATGDRWGTAVCLTIDGFAAAELGSVTTALEETEQAQRMFAELSETWGQTLALVARGAALRAANEHAQATECLQDAVRAAVRTGQLVTGALALGVLGYCRLDVGDLDAAAAAAEQALAAHRRTRPAAAGADRTAGAARAGSARARRAAGRAAAVARGGGGAGGRLAVLPAPAGARAPRRCAARAG